MQQIEKLFESIHEVERQFIQNKLEVARKETMFKNIKYVEHERHREHDEDSGEFYYVFVKFNVDNEYDLFICNNIYCSSTEICACIARLDFKDRHDLYFTDCDYNYTINNRKKYSISDSFGPEFVKPILDMLIFSMECEKKKLQNM